MSLLHRCPLPCHPAHCDPCNVMLRLQCHCGKEDKTIKCGTLHPQMGVTSQVIDVNDYLSCRQACDKLLGCGLHRCEKECHSGDCGDCELIREKTCYCGQEQKEEVCGTASQAELRHTCFAEESEKSWTGEWSCRQPSTWKFDCGIHEEASTERKICHPHAGPSRLPCPRAPSVVSTCACGQMPLQALANPPRNKCTDAIPSCGKICNKKLKTCEHSCPALCHEGQCQRCEETVTLVCRCGNEKKTMKCHQLQEEGEEELRCERICRALRACGRHECGRKVSCRVYAGQGSYHRSDAVLSRSAVLLPIKRLTRSKGVGRFMRKTKTRSDFTCVTASVDASSIAVSIPARSQITEGLARRASDRPSTRSPVIAAQPSSFPQCPAPHVSSAISSVLAQVRPVVMQRRRTPATRMTSLALRVLS